jgi:hypothetical protein
MPGLRMAAEMGSGLESAPQHGGQVTLVAVGDFERCAAVPDDERGIVLFDRVRGLFLGL